MNDSEKPEASSETPQETVKTEDEFAEPATIDDEPAWLVTVTHAVKRFGNAVSKTSVTVWSWLKSWWGRFCTHLRTVPWRSPQRTYLHFFGTRANKVRSAVVIGTVVVLTLGVFLLWPAPNSEACEFLARPAAKLYIDGQLASEEVPPIYRTRLELGEHSIRFVSPNDQTHEASITVEKGRQTQWIMNFVEDRLYERPSQ